MRVLEANQDYIGYKISLGAYKSEYFCALLNFDRIINFHKFPETRDRKLPGRHNHI